EERPIDTHDGDAARLFALAPFARGHRGLQQNGRADAPLGTDGQAQLVAEFLAEEARRHQGLINPPEPAQRPLPEAPLQPVAAQQRSGQDGSADDNAEHHGQVAASVVGQVAPHESEKRHGGWKEKRVCRLIADSWSLMADPEDQQDSYQLSAVSYQLLSN